MSIFLENTSKEQSVVIKEENINNSPLLIIAGAGSGKTTTIINRLGYHIEQKYIKPDNVLALSFSNKSAKEIGDRVKAKLGNLGNGISTGTFHSIALRILKDNSDNFKKYKILDENDNKKYIKKIYDNIYGDKIKELKDEYKSGILDEQEFEHFMQKLSGIKDILWCISRSKNTNENIYNIIINKLFEKNENVEIERKSEYIGFLTTLMSSEKYEEFYNKILEYGKNIQIEELDLLNLKFAVKTIKEYEKTKIKDKYLTFDDLLINVVSFLDKNELIRKKLDEKYKYIFIDEFQDVNFIQLQFVKLLNKDFNYLFLVGDSDQAIYSFRGCDSYYFNNIKNIYPNTRIHYLNDNYRSDGHIVATANISISNNVNRYNKIMNNIKEAINIPKYISTYSEKELFEQICQQIINNGEDDYKETAILYRNNMHSYQIQKKLIEYKIPFNVVGGQNLLNKKYIKDLVSLLQLTISLDPISVERVIKTYPKIGDKKVEKILQQIEEVKFNDGDIFEELNVLNKLKELIKLSEKLIKFHDNKINHIELLNYYKDHIIIDDVYKNIEGNKIELEIDTINDFIFMIEDMLLDGIEINEIMEMLYLDNVDNKNKKDEEMNKVTLSTIHRAKGLEWKNVFLIKGYEGIFPTFKSLSNQFLLEEERNLFYVALTRAKDFLYIYMPTISSNGYGDEKLIYDSMFVNEIREALD